MISTDNVVSVDTSFRSGFLHSVLGVSMPRINAHARDRRVVSRATPVIFPFIELGFAEMASTVIDNGLDPDLDTSFVVTSDTGFADGDVIIPVLPSGVIASAVPLDPRTAELIRLDSVTAGPLTFHVTRGFGGSTPSNLIDGDVLASYGLPTQQTIDVTPNVVALVGAGEIGVSVETPGGTVAANSVVAVSGGSLRFGFPSPIYDWSRFDVSPLAARVRGRAGQPLAAGQYFRMVAATP